MRWGTIIINADDLGYDSKINRAIVTCLKNGYVSSATIMANMPGLEEACDLIHRDHLQNAIGLHIVLDEGEPLTEDMKRLERFCDSNGRFKRRKSGAYLFLTREEQRCVYKEIVAQVKTIRAGGINIAHVDSHRNIHEELGIARIVLRIAKEFGIPSVRSCRNVGYQRSKAIFAYRKTVNSLIRWKGKQRTVLMGSFRDFHYCASQRSPAFINQSAEVMVHPTFDDNGELVDSTSQEADVLRISQLSYMDHRTTMQQVWDFFRS